MKYQEYRIRALISTNLWLYPSELSPIEKVVLQAILFLSDKETMEVSYATIAEYTKISVTAVKTTIAKLRDKNIIKTVRQMLGHIYIFQWHKAEIFASIFGKNANPASERIGGTNTNLFNNIDNYYNKYNNYHYLFQISSYEDKEINKLLKSEMRLRRRKETKETLPWYDALIKPKEPLPKKEAPMRIPTEVKSLIEYWKFCGLHVPKETTKAYREDLLAFKRLLNGRTFGQKYTSEQIKQSITDFSGAALDPAYEPADKDVKARLAKYSVKSFILNSFAKNKSLFQQYLAEPPRRVIPLIEDKNPMITEHLKRFYFKRILKKAFTRLSDNDENKFRKATLRLLELIRSPEVRSRLGCTGLSKMDVVDIFCKSILENVNGKTVTPGWFCNDITFDIFAKLLKDRALMEAPQADSSEYRYNELY